MWTVAESFIRYGVSCSPGRWRVEAWPYRQCAGARRRRERPSSVYDTVLAVDYSPCRNGWHLPRESDLNRAILGNNNSQDCLNTVLSRPECCRKGTRGIPDGSG